MILSRDSIKAITARLSRVVYLRDHMEIIRLPPFRDSFIHGTALLGGGLLGLILFSMTQSAPPHAPYQTQVAITAPAPEKAATEHADDQAHKDNAAATPAQGAEPNTAHAEHDTSATTQEAVQQPLTTPPAQVILPFDGLSETKAPYGTLPIVRATDHVRPFDAYRRAFDTANLNKPLIALVMLDYGLSVENSKSVLDVLPDQVTFVLSGAADSAPNWPQQAYDHGHELWLGLRVEPVDYPQSDPGANALLTGVSVQQNETALLTQLGQFVGYTGVFASETSPYFESGSDADFMANGIFSRGLGLMLNTSTANPVIKTDAQASKSPFYAASMFHVNTAKNTADLLAQAEKNATDKGFSVVIFRPTPVARKAILDWWATLDQKGFALAPLSVIAERGMELTR